MSKEVINMYAYVLDNYLPRSMYNTFEFITDVLYKARRDGKLT